jgi:hypothetical protein
VKQLTMGCGSSKEDPSPTFSSVTTLAKYPEERYPEAKLYEIPVAEAIPVVMGYPAYFSETPPISYDTSKLLAVMHEYNIGPHYLEDLINLTHFDIVILCDDSTSMNTPDGHLNGMTVSRWDELKHVVQMVVKVGAALDSDGIDVLFFHREGLANVSDVSQVNELFRQAPPNYQPTPLTATTDRILKEHTPGPKPLLLVIATDGVPTDAEGHRSDSITRDFTNTLKGKSHNKVFVSILACSDDDRDIGYLNKLDVDVPGLDVLDDYRSEYAEVISKQGRGHLYTHGDHVARLLLGPTNAKYDKIDEGRV